jgi:predicted AAA+ superfamily ATPase
MQNLIYKSDKKIRNISLETTRYLLSALHLKNRLTIIKGARGTGKTTLLLQFAKKYLNKKNEVLYVALDDLFFKENTIYGLAEEFEKNNGHLLLLDEVHKYPNWSREIKLIYDDFPDLNLLITSSSLLEIYKSESDLSRRAVSYTLKELSLREFLIFEEKIYLDTFSLEDIIENHIEISYEITSKIKPIYQFNKYIKYGMYPYYWENEEAFYEKLIQTIHLTLEIDLPAVEAIDYNHIVKLKRLLFAISTSAPFTPNIVKLSERIEISRQALIKALHYLERARLIILLQKRNKGISILSKPDKVYINNPNIQNALAINNEIDMGALRESFMVNQLQGLHKMTIPQNGDLLVDDYYTFEIGGKSKTKSQIKGIENAYLIKDNIENGTQGIIPLWLFGFLY